MRKFKTIICCGWLCATALSGSIAMAGPSYFTQTNLASDVPGLATVTDPLLKNPWGVSFSATSPFWISDQASGVSTLYRFTAGVFSAVPLVVSIPTTLTGPQGPTGQVNNNTSAFLLNGVAANFIFANLNGTISAWNGGAGTTAQVKATTPGAVYTGLALASNGVAPRLYAANAAQNRIDVFDGAFAPISLGANAFVNSDPQFAGLVPFNVANIDGKIYVTYAAPTHALQAVAPEGSGGVAIFDTSGNFIRSLVAGSKLASPWGMAVAPVSFGDFGGDLLVGNFSYAFGEINAFDPLTGALKGTISDQLGNPILNAGLWALTFGNGGSGGNVNTLYFTAGINRESNGLFGALAVNVPAPPSLLLLALGLALMILRRRWRGGVADRAGVDASALSV